MGIVQAHKELIALRRNQLAISAGLCSEQINISHLDENNRVLAYHRWRNGGPKDDVVVVINFEHTYHKSYDMSFPRNGQWLVRFNSADNKFLAQNKDFTGGNVFVENGGGTLVLPPYSVLILSQNN